MEVSNNIIYLIVGILLVAGLVSSYFYFFLPMIKSAQTDKNVYSCEIDTDCVKFQADCCGCNQGGKAKTVNKKYEAQLKNQMDNLCKDIICPQVISTDASCSKQPKCINQECALV